MAKNRFTASWPWSSLRRSSPLTTWARDPESDPDKTDPERQARRLFHDVGLIAEALVDPQRLGDQSDIMEKAAPDWPRDVSSRGREPG